KCIGNIGNIGNPLAACQRSIHIQRDTLYNMENFDYITWIVTPLLIFLARLLDVSLATIRHILIFRGMKKVVPVFAFIEVSIWLLAIAQVMQNVSNIACFLAFAAGFSAGTYVGMVIEERLALGFQLVRVIFPGDTADLRVSLKQEGYGVTTIDARGARGAVEILLIVSARRRLFKLLDLLAKLDPKPFFTVEDVRSVGSTMLRRSSMPGDFAYEGTVKKK